ncbi:MAG: hypothetical protein LC799_30685 [Actinobacteria bacterium]|nr:hypothetical protein [Actinomycetota bacterium]
MFIQVVRGRVRDAPGLREHWDLRIHELRQHPEVVPDAGLIEVPVSVGWLGSTAGISDEGEFVAVIRFESERLARQDDRRPEQREWWDKAKEYFDGEVTVHDCSEVDIILDGGSDDAAFVQVIQGRAKDVDRVRALNSASEAWLKEYRPGIIGGTVAWHEDGSFTETLYFTSEEESRESEELPAGARNELDEWRALVEDVRYINLRDPWLWSPGEVTV